MRHVDELDSRAADFGGAHDLGIGAGKLDLELVFEDVDDFVGQEADRARLGGDDKNRSTTASKGLISGEIGMICIRRPCSRTTRRPSELSTRWVSTISMRETSESGKTLGAPEPALEHDQAAVLVHALSRDMIALLLSRLLDAEVGGDAEGSRMSTTEPSPRMVWPLKTLRCESEALKGLTTIS